MDMLRIGRIEFGSRSALELLTANGLVDLDSVFGCGEVIPCRHKVKGVAVATLHDGERPVRVFIKKQWRRSRWIPRMPDLRFGKAFWSYPLCEWRGLLRFQEIGLDTAEPLALFRHRWHPCRAAVVTGAVPCEMSLREMIENGTLAGLDASARAALGDAIVAVIQRIHQSGLGWRSMNIKHFFPAREDDGRWRIWLIDCEGVHGRVTPYYIQRDRKEFVMTIRKAGGKQPQIEPFAQQIERRLLNGPPTPTSRPHHAKRQSQVGHAPRA
ncbi:MAG TPA: lipopolysaccharide kinase InaA family protein [Thermoguttaceae bacterium]|nr:lipopolysaccharide kinase InaA family protein [Thermoguttaceae bacterium]